MQESVNWRIESKVIDTNFEKVIANAKYVSFDIFDTLLKRHVSQPRNVFDLVQFQYNCNNLDKINDFKRKRIQAERQARKNAKREDVTIDEIYQLLQYDEEKKRQLRALEIYIEKMVCYPNKSIIEIYDIVKSRGITIIITSDMYLTHEIIEEILFSIGISGYNKLYLSSEVGFTKRTGHLFDYILRDLQISSNEIVHIGDNVESDYNIPMNKGINSYLVNHKLLLHDYFPKNSKRIEIDFLSNFLQNTIDRSQGTNYFLGYSVVGPFLYNFCNWLHEVIKRNEFDFVFFIAREGYLPYMVYKKMFHKESDNIKYIRLNKNLLRLPILYLDSSISNFLSSIPKRDYYTISQILDLLQFSKIEIEENIVLQKILDESKYELNTKIRRNNVESNADFLIFYKKCLQIQKKEMEKQYKLLLQYIEKNEIRGKVALVNNSINANMQGYLNEIVASEKMNIDIWGIHFIISNKGAKRIKKQFYAWFDKSCNQFDKRIFSRNSLVFEHLLFENCGTALKFFFEENVNVQNEDIGRESMNEKTIDEIMKGTMGFIDCYSKGLALVVDRKYILKMIVNFFMYPNKKDADEVSKIIDSDFDSSSPLAMQISDVSYSNKMTRNNNLIKWKQGYLTINNRNICNSIYNMYLHIELIKKNIY